MTHADRERLRETTEFHSRTVRLDVFRYIVDRVNNVSSFVVLVLKITKIHLAFYLDFSSPEKQNPIYTIRSFLENFNFSFTVIDVIK